MTLASLSGDPAQVAHALALGLRREPIAAAWLYGSVARGDARRDSDVDLAVLFAAHLQTDRSRVRLEIEREAARLLDGRELSVVDLERAPLLLRHRVLRDGVLLAEPDPSTRARFAARVLENFFATRSVRSSFDNATRYRLAHGGLAMGAM